MIYTEYTYNIYSSLIDIEILTDFLFHFHKEQTKWNTQILLGFKKFVSYEMIEFG